jgi:outer membrane receptor for ferrienterochelin and colicin
VGDEGTTELSGATRRRGLEVEGRWQVCPGVWLEADATRSAGRYRETGEVIARAPRFTLNAAAILSERSGWGAQLRVRHVGDHPANETGSATALGFTAVDLTVRRRLSSGWTLVAALENMFDAEIREAQTWFASRLAHERAAVEDIHFSPGNPRALRIGLHYAFDPQ